MEEIIIETDFTKICERCNKTLAQCECQFIQPQEKLSGKIPKRKTDNIFSDDEFDSNNPVND